MKLQVDMSHPIEKMFSTICSRFLKYCRNYTSFPKMQGGIAPKSFGDSINVENYSFINVCNAGANAIGSMKCCCDCGLTIKAAMATVNRF